MKGVIESLSLALDGDLRVTVQVPRHHLEELGALKDAPLSIEIKKWRKRRSLTQNAYCWVLIGKIAECMSPPLNKMDVYKEMLKRYGQHTIISVEDDKLDAVKRELDYWDEAGKGFVNGKAFTHLHMFVGSSKYDSREMSVFVSGIVEEARELGIETLTPEELARMEL